MGVVTYAYFNMCNHNSEKDQVSYTNDLLHKEANSRVSGPISLTQWYIKFPGFHMRRQRS